MPVDTHRTEIVSHHREPVDSHVFAGASYDWEHELLELEFTDGSVYLYHDVPPKLYHRMMAAYSPGQFYNDLIRGIYRSERVERPRSRRGLSRRAQQRRRVELTGV